MAYLILCPLLYVQAETFVSGKVVKLERVSTSINGDTKVGDNYGGLGCKFNQPGSWTIQTDNTIANVNLFLDLDKLTVLVGELLVERGVDMATKDSRNPFGSVNPDIIITADISELTMYTCSALSGHKAKGNLGLKVDWRLFNTKTETLITELSTVGASESKKKINNLYTWMINNSMSEATVKFLDVMNQ